MLLPPAAAGLSLLCLAPPGAVAQVVLQEWPGDALCRNLGRAVADPGDLNGDGHPDLLIGAPGCALSASFVPGAVLAFDGASAAPLYQIWGVQRADNFGRALTMVGDCDGDQVADFLAGTFTIGPQAGLGYARLCSGAGGATLQTHWEPFSNSAFASALCALGDLDRDGFPDYAVAAPLEPPSGSGQRAGVVRVYSSASGNVLYWRAGAADYDQLGTALATIGDVDRDGFLDFAAGAPMGQLRYGPGAVQLYSGRSGALLRSWFGALVNDQFGAAVAAAGDLDRDGTPDLFIGSPGWPGGAGRGRAQAYSGASGALLWIFDGRHDGDNYGVGVSGGADWNGDGVPDLAAAACSDENGTGSGSVEIHSGVDGLLLYRLYGLSRGADLGRALATAADRNGDGRPELLVGAPVAWSGGNTPGVVYLHSGWDGRPVLDVRDHAAGTSAVLEVRHATPGQSVWIGVSRAGPGPTPTPWGPAALSPPIRALPPLPVNGAGVATFSFLLPLGLAGASVWLHGFEAGSLGALRWTNPRVIVVQ